MALNIINRINSKANLKKLFVSGPWPGKFFYQSNPASTLTFFLI